MSANEKRKAFKDYGLERPDDTVLADIPMIKLDKALWEPLFLLLGQKFALALHHQALGRPLCRSGGLWVSVKTNAKVIAGRLEEQFLDG